MSQEAVFLRHAFILAEEELGPEFDLDETARLKLAKIVATIARRRMQSGGNLSSDEDAASVAALSSSRFIGLKAE